MKIVLLAGSKSSGKTTAATAIYGYHLTQIGSIPNASIDELGRMSIMFNESTKEGIYFDIDDKSPEFLDYKNKHTAQHINHVGFADELKRVACDLFGLDYTKITGTNDQKNEASHIKWEDMLKVLPGNKRKLFKDKKGPMTNREFLETFGTDICRSIYGDCHVLSAYKKLVELNPDIGLITDCRFENEFEFKEFQNNPDVLRIRLLRNPFKSNSESEKGLENIPLDKFDLVVPEDATLKEKNNMVINFLIKRGILSSGSIRVNK